MAESYLIGLGSNMRVPGIGTPRDVLLDAVAAMEEAGLTVRAMSPIMSSAPVGPSNRRYANAAAWVQSELPPIALLAVLHDIEASYGRERRGQRWRARPLDLDILLWNGGVYDDARLQIPHIRLRERPFVLGPASRIAPEWIDPVTGLSLRALYARLTKPRPLPR